MTKIDLNDRKERRARFLPWKERSGVPGDGGDGQGTGFDCEVLNASRAV